ncbi:MAG: SpoIIE family protein phosphatase, partial [Oligoflexales bacterium]|nr:SpoIIE family protein phosphatase [Oligoflexales bacterium]
LPIVRSYLEILGGQIKVKSEFGKGTRFELSLPLQRVSGDISLDREGGRTEPISEKPLLKSLENDSPAIADPENKKEPHPIFQSESEKNKILVVDDHKYNCEVIRDILHAEGYHVEMALGGQEGIERMKGFLPDLVLLDMMMPGLSGEDFIKYMKDNSKYDNIPVIFITARSSEDDVILGLQMGADDYLTKPIISEELKLRVSNILSRIMYTRTQSERETIIKNIALIQEVHESFGSLSRGIPHIRVADCYKAAENVGGDWRAIFFDEKQKILEILIGDVTGHGISSAIYTVAAAGAIKNAISMLDDMPDNRRSIDRVKFIAKHLNNAILETSRRLEKMMTMAVISINLENGDSAVLSAGHHPCMLAGRGDVRMFMASGNPIGMDSIQNFESEEFQFSKGEILFLYTDGLLENRGVNGKNMRRIKLKEIVGSSHDVDEIKKNILATVSDLWGDGAIEDDYSFLVVQRI